MLRVPRGTVTTIAKIIKIVLFLPLLSVQTGVCGYVETKVALGRVATFLRWLINCQGRALPAISAFIYYCLLRNLPSFLFAPECAESVHITLFGEETQSMLRGTMTLARARLQT
uniref:Putative secreted protein n=1 Tax=Amblyomma cajennense TaxID=34607 RepID=A0A023FBV2_AMBCJ